MRECVLNRVLCVDDEKEMRAVIQLVLEELGGFTVQTCNSGLEALSCVMDFAPDLILLDATMPGMDGPSTLLALRSMPGLADIAVIFVTGRIHTQDVAHFKSLGALGVIAKPFDPMSLITHIRDLWHGRQQYQ